MNFNKTFILSSVFTLAMCSSGRVTVPALANTYDTTRDLTATYEDFNFTRSLFNQFSNTLDYTLRVTMPEDYGNVVVFSYVETSTSSPITLSTSSFTLISSDPYVYEYELSGVWKTRINNALFGRNFDSSTGVSERYPYVRIIKPNVQDDDITYFNFTIKSSIKYRINIGTALLGWRTQVIYDDPVSDGASLISMFNENNESLASFYMFNLESDDPTANTNLLYKITFPEIVNNVSRFDLSFAIIGGTVKNVGYELNEFNLFTYSDDLVVIPENAGDNLFGLEFIAVAWYDILGHFNNFLWWLVNASFLRPIFLWIETYIIGFITVFFNTIATVLGLT